MSITCILRLTGQKWWYWVQGSKCVSIMMFKACVEGLRTMLVAPSQRAEIVITTTVLQVRWASYTAPIIGFKNFIVKEAREY